MADIIRALTEAVDKIGLLAVLILVIVSGTGFVAMWNQRLVAAINRLTTETISRNTAELHENTRVMRELTAYIHQLGSDPSKLCKIIEYQEKIDHLQKSIDKLMNRD